MGEHLLCKQGVVGSIPTRSTNSDDLTIKRRNLHLIVQSDDIDIV